MKRTAIITAIAVLGISTWSFGQNKPATPASGQAAGQTAAAPAGKRPPQAKTQPEFDAYKIGGGDHRSGGAGKGGGRFRDEVSGQRVAGIALQIGDAQLPTGQQWRQDAGHVAESIDFRSGRSAKRCWAWRRCWRSARATPIWIRISGWRKPEKMRSARWSRSIRTSPPPGNCRRKWMRTKGFLKSDAYAILGTLDFNAKAWAAAEQNLKKSIDAFPQQPDPIAVFRLSVALDMQNKYPDALKYANQAVDLTKAGTRPATRLARRRIVWCS